MNAVCFTNRFIAYRTNIWILRIFSTWTYVTPSSFIWVWRNCLSGFVSVISYSILLIICSISCNSRRFIFGIISSFTNFIPNFRRGVDEFIFLQLYFIYNYILKKKQRGYSLLKNWFRDLLLAFYALSKRD